MKELRKIIQEQISLVLESKSGTKFIDALRNVISDNGELNKYSKITKIKGWPKVPSSDGYDDELGTLDLENNEFIKIDDNKLVLITGGDWQDPWVVEVGWKNGELQVLKYRKAERGEYKAKERMKSSDMLAKLYEDHPMHKDKTEFLNLVKSHLKDYGPWDNSYGDEQYDENKIIEGPKLNEDKSGMYAIWHIGGHEKAKQTVHDEETGETHEEFLNKRFNEWPEKKVWAGKDMQAEIDGQKYNVKTNVESLGDDKVKYSITLKEKNGKGKK